MIDDGFVFCLTASNYQGWAVVSTAQSWSHYLCGEFRQSNGTMAELLDGWKWKKICRTYRAIVCRYASEIVTHTIRNNWYNGDLITESSTLADFFSFIFHKPRIIVSPNSVQSCQWGLNSSQILKSSTISRLKVWRLCNCSSWLQQQPRISCLVTTQLGNYRNGSRHRDFWVVENGFKIDQSRDMGHWAIVYVDDDGYWRFEEVESKHVWQ